MGSKCFTEGEKDKRTQVVKKDSIKYVGIKLSIKEFLIKS